MFLNSVSNFSLFTFFGKWRSLHLKLYLAFSQRSASPRKPRQEAQNQWNFFSVANTSQFWARFKIHDINPSWLATATKCTLFSIADSSSKTYIHSTFHTSDFKWKRAVGRPPLKTDLLDLVEPAWGASTRIDVHVLTFWKWSLIQENYSVSIYGRAMMQRAFWRSCCKEAGAPVPLVWVILCSNKNIHMLH